MKRHKMIETLKKIGAASAAVCLAALFFIMLAVSGHTAPENPMEDKDADAIPYVFDIVHTCYG